MASATLNLELDSLFLKGLRLLHSSEPDAEEQLQQLWKQAVVDKYGLERTPTSVLHKITEPATVKRENQDVTSDLAVEAKRLKLECSVFPPPISTLPHQSVFVSVDTKDSSGDEVSPLEILNTESFCKKCKTSTSPASDKLVECVDCHKHYHQACHFPPISDMDLSDPRFVWYCSSCDQNITATTTDKTKSANSSTVKSGNSSKGPAATSKNGRIHSTNNKSTTQGSTGSTNNTSKTVESNTKEIGNSNSSNTPEKKGHMMKKRSIKKLDKKNRPNSASSCESSHK